MTMGAWRCVSQRRRLRAACGQRASRISAPKLMEITDCVAGHVLGEWDVPCPLAGETPSLKPGCRRCEMVRHLEPLHAAHRASGGAWVSLGDFAQRFAPNAWLRERRFTQVCHTL